MIYILLCNKVHMCYVFRQVLVVVNPLNPHWLCSDTSYSRVILPDLDCLWHIKKDGAGECWFSLLSCFKCCKMQVVKGPAQSHIHNVDWHFASPNVVISLQIICLPLDGCCISTHSSTIFPSVLTAPNFIALCQSGLEITVTDTHPAHFREIISMLSVQHVATQHQSLVQDHYQKLLPLWPGHFIPAI